MSTEFSNDDVIKTTEERHSSHTGMFVLLAAGLAIALAGDGYLMVRANHLDQQISQNGDATQAQIAKLGNATSSLLEQRLATINDEMSSQVKGVQSGAATALKQARAQAAKQDEELRGQLEEQQQQVTGQIAQLKDATSEADTKIAAVSTDVDGVKTDVNGVKTDVNGVKTDVATTKDGLEKTGADLKRAMGDMGVMSGLIATNSKDLQALRDLGERNYVEFDLNKGKMQQKIGDVVLTLRKTDPKHNRYTVEVTADDKITEKRDKTIDEPVQVYVHNSRWPDEIVVNQVKNNEIVGYLSVPKITMARQ